MFKDFDSLSESDCFNITGSTKNQFKLFASYITSVKPSKKRNKLWLIAIYLYWLRKGDNRSTLACMKERFIQRDISRYLSQIKLAIYLIRLDIYIHFRLEFYINTMHSFFYIDILSNILRLLNMFNLVNITNNLIIF